MVPISEVAICNLALSHLGQSPIVNIRPPDPNKSARQLNLIYDMTRDAVLRAKDWKFASVKAPLAEIADQEIAGWSYVYVYPAKCLCIRKVFYDVESTDPKPIEFETLFIPGIHQKVIVTNYKDAYIAYTYQMVDPSLYDMSFVMAFSFLLAAQAAKPLTGDDKRATLMLELYGSLISDAGRLNDIEKYTKKEETSSFEDAR